MASSVEAIVEKIFKVSLKGNVSKLIMPYIRLQGMTT